MESRRRAQAADCEPSEDQACISQASYCRGYSGEDPPLPIPNREVKLTIADGTDPPVGRVGSRGSSKPRASCDARGFFLLPVAAAVRAPPPLWPASPSMPAWLPSCCGGRVATKSPGKRAFPPFYRGGRPPSSHHSRRSSLLFEHSFLCHFERSREIFSVIPRLVRGICFPRG